VGNADVISFPGILSGGGEGDGFFLPKLGAGVSVAMLFSWNFVLREREEGEGCLQVGAGVRVQKLLAFCGGLSVGELLEVTLNDARVGVRIANVINIFLVHNKF